MDYVAARRRMVVDQLTVEGRDITDPQVLKAMGEVPRHLFVPSDLRGESYEDKPLPIGFGQTISQPYIVAYMIQALELKRSDRILEVGAGSGYAAAVLSRIVDQVFAVEIVEPLVVAAVGVLKEVGYENVSVKAGDGNHGRPEHAPFDAILVSCAPDRVPKALGDQLVEGGRLIVPLGRNARLQQLCLMKKQRDVLTRQRLLTVRFVPMTGSVE